LTWLQPQSFSWQNVQQNGCQEDSWGLQTLQEISITFKDPHCVLFIIAEEQEKLKSDEAKQMQAATGQTRAHRRSRSLKITNRDAMSDAFSTSFEAAAVPGAWPPNDVVPLKLGKAIRQSAVAVRGSVAS
jgi:hypothetical protein